jgi:hypothetical protein
MTDVTITAANTEHDWSRMPVRMRLRVVWSVLRGRPFAVPGSMTIVAVNARYADDAPALPGGSRGE